MTREDLAEQLALLGCPGIGPVRFRAIHDALQGRLGELFDLGRSELEALGLKPPQIEALRAADPARVEPVMEWLEASPEHHLLDLSDPLYPPLLRELQDAPPLLFARGRIELLRQPQLAMVGSRNCTPGGARTARDFAGELAHRGLVITSGLALGIDAEAHRGALDAGGGSIAVVGTGIDRIYPSRNRALAQRLAVEGLILSEFPLGTPPNSENFPRRNRVISGLSRATLVVEAARRSGSLITARCSVEQGRDVFAIPGSIHNPQAKGCHQLIREGAKLVEEVAHILDELAPWLDEDESEAELSETAAEMPVSELGEEYHSLLEQMGYDPVSLDQLAARSGLTVAELSSMLLRLELNDLIQTLPGGLYQRC